MAINGTNSLETHPDPAGPAQSPTAYLLNELALHGHRPHQDEPDPRPLPETHACEGALNDIFDILGQTGICSSVKVLNLMRAGKAAPSPTNNASCLGNDESKVVIAPKVSGSILATWF